MAGPYDEGYNPGDSGYKAPKTKKAKKAKKSLPRRSIDDRTNIAPRRSAGPTPVAPAPRQTRGGSSTPPPSTPPRNHGAAVSAMARSGAGGRAVSQVARSGVGKKNPKSRGATPTKVNPVNTSPRPGFLEPERPKQPVKTLPVRKRAGQR